LLSITDGRRFSMGIKIGRGFTVTGEGKLRRKPKGGMSVSEKIRQRNSKKTRVVSKAKAMAKAQRP
jgi:hypothetical protein